MMNLSSLGEMIEGGLGRLIRTQQRKEGLQILASLLGKLGQERSVAARFEMVAKYYRPLLRQRFDNWPQRAQDLEAVAQIASRYKNMEEFLADLAIDPPETSSATLPDKEDALTLSTIHSAKGLEWEAVYLMGLIEGGLPSGFALAKLEDVEEEHRLFYVALTRAKRHLFLSFPHESSWRGKREFNEASRFVLEPSVLDRIEDQVFMGRDEEVEEKDEEYDEDGISYEDAY
jgi:DNA helicase-2/ATP-dependent DNA helicase PcrA